MDDHDKRIQNILSPGCWRNRENTKIYLAFLREKIKFPCRLTVADDYPWEESYGTGSMDKDEHKKIKTDEPAFADVYELIELLEPKPADDDICAKLKSLTDFKIYEIGLSWLECHDTDNKNFQLIKDYTLWYANY